MSYLYRPTPVFNPGPSAASLSGAVSGGVMRGYDGSVNWKAYFDSKRAAPQGDPWIVKSGTMGSFQLKGMGDVDPLTGEVIYDSPVSFDPGIFDPGTLPLTPYANDPTLNPISNYPGLPSSFFNMAPPSFPGGAPAIVSSGGSVLTPPSAPAAVPGSPALPGFSWTAVVAPLASLATSITKAVSGSGSSAPAIAPTTVQANAQIAQAQALQAQANALQNTNPTLAAQYRAQANALLTGAGASSGTSWFTQSSIISGVSNVTVLLGGLAVVVLGGALVAGRRGK
jgi:hypothetical protein